MSVVPEVLRWTAHLDERKDDGRTVLGTFPVVIAEDHDRIVAKLKQERDALRDEIADKLEVVLRAARSGDLLELSSLDLPTTVVEVEREELRQERDALREENRWLRKEASTATCVSAEIVEERIRGIVKFGAQLHLPSVDRALLEREGGCTPERMAEHYEVPSEARAKSLLELAFARREGTWVHIVLEELCEAIGAPDEVQRRAEVVQVAATCIGWIDAIDHQAALRREAVAR